MRFSSGIRPASESLVAFTIIMNRISCLLAVWNRGFSKNPPGSPSRRIRFCDLDRPNGFFWLRLCGFVLADLVDDRCAFFDDLRTEIGCLEDLPDFNDFIF